MASKHQNTNVGYHIVEKAGIAWPVRRIAGKIVFNN